MAALHSHTPGFVVFSQTSVPVRIISNGASFIGNGLKNWVIGAYDPRVRVVSNPALEGASTIYSLRRQRPAARTPAPVFWRPISSGGSVRDGERTWE